MSDRPHLEEGWYLMSVADLERELGRWRAPERDPGPSGAEKLSIERALSYRNAGNLPDDRGRTLRLVLHITSPEDLTGIDAKRLLYEPDFHDAPTWRREGSKPVNVVPLRSDVPGRTGAWWENPEVAALESEWRASGTVAGVRVPEEYRSFVFKTVIALRAAGREVNATAIADSIARWLPEEDAERVRGALDDSA